MPVDIQYTEVPLHALTRPWDTTEIDIFPKLQFVWSGFISIIILQIRLHGIVALLVATFGVLKRG